LERCGGAPVRAGVPDPLSHDAQRFAAFVLQLFNVLETAENTIAESAHGSGPIVIEPSGQFHPYGFDLGWVACKRPRLSDRPGVIFRAVSISTNGLDDPPRDEAEHFIRCPKCNGWVDMRDLGQVFEHEGPLPHPAEDHAQ
jgi:hypothetical protein